MSGERCRPEVHAGAPPRGVLALLVMTLLGCVPSPPPSAPIVDVPVRAVGPPAPEPPALPAPEPAPVESRVPAIDAAAEAVMVEKINAYRTAHGLAALRVHPALVDKARTWARAMASGACGQDPTGAPKICHSSLREGVTVQYALLAENVGRVAPPAMGLLQSAFEASPSHSAEMLHPTFESVGVGVAYWQDYMFVAEVFMESLR